jgi:hypothetical protein
MLVVDTVIVYVAGKEMARAPATSKGHVMYNQQTYSSVINFYTDLIQYTCALKFDKYYSQVNKKQYDICYKSVQGEGG